VRRLALILSFLCAALPALAVGKAEHVVVVVWDGMRPDFVNKTNTPTLYQLAHDGVFFQNHHAVFLSSTEANATAMATGAYPSRNGILGNREYRPNIDLLKRIDTQALAAVRKGDEITHNHYIQLPTIAEILQRAGKKTAIAGAKPVALLFDRFETNRACKDCVNLFGRDTVPATALARLNLPVFTPQGVPNTRQDNTITEALIGAMWDKQVPEFSLLWLSEPDATQHQTGLGSTKSLQALKGSDDNLARVLKELTARGIRDKTDVFVISDHGFSTVSRIVNMIDALRKAGFNAVREFTEFPTNDDVLVIGNGGTVLLYVVGHNSTLIQKLVEFLQAQDSTGVIATREPLKGAFTLDQVRINTADAPDIVVSLRWSDEKNDAGVPGSVASEGWTTVGIHSSLSRFDLHNTLIAAGPDFQRGFVDHMPSGNIDLAPTVLSLLGVPPPQPMDGRVLYEAFMDQDFKSSPARVSILDATNTIGNVVWHQYLKVEKYAGAYIYLDEGNGSQEPKK